MTITSFLPLFVCLVCHTIQYIPLYGREIHLWPNRPYYWCLWWCCCIRLTGRLILRRTRFHRSVSTYLEHHKKLYRLSLQHDIPHPSLGFDCYVKSFDFLSFSPTNETTLNVYDNDIMLEDRAVYASLLGALFLLDMICIWVLRANATHPPTPTLGAQLTWWWIQIKHTQNGFIFSHHRNDRQREHPFLEESSRVRITRINWRVSYVWQNTNSDSQLYQSGTKLFRPRDTTHAIITS